MDYAGALTLSELSRRDVDDYPSVIAVMGVVALDAVAVLFARLGNPAENEDEALVVSAGRVVMAADVQVGNFKPQIEINVVLLASFEGIIVFAARASNNLELVVEAAHGVTMAGVLHVVHAEAIKIVRVVIDNLETLFKRGRLPLDISASDQENLIARSLYVGEVVLKSCLNVH